MAKTFYILGEINPKKPNDLKIVVGRGVLAPAKEAIHAANVQLRRIVALQVFDASANSAGTVVTSKMSPIMAPAVQYGSITPAPRNFASIIVQSSGAVAGSISFGFIAYGE